MNTNRKFKVGDEVFVKCENMRAQKEYTKERCAYILRKGT